MMAAISLPKPVMMVFFVEILLYTTILVPVFPFPCLKLLGQIWQL